MDSANIGELIRTGGPLLMLIATAIITFVTTRANNAANRAAAASASVKEIADQTLDVSIKTHDQVNSRMTAAMTKIDAQAAQIAALLADFSTYKKNIAVTAAIEGKPEPDAKGKTP